MYNLYQPNFMRSSPTPRIWLDVLPSQHTSAFPAYSMAACLYMLSPQGQQVRKVCAASESVTILVALSGSFKCIVTFRSRCRGRIACRFRNRLLLLNLCRFFDRIFLLLGYVLFWGSSPNFLPLEGLLIYFPSQILLFFRQFLIFIFLQQGLVFMVICNPTEKRKVPYRDILD